MVSLRSRVYHTDIGVLWDLVGFWAAPKNLELEMLTIFRTLPNRLKYCS